MKIALVSPYDFAYPGGVCNHIACLDHHLTRMGHAVKIIAPASRAVSALGDRLIPVGKPRPVPVSGSIARITFSPWLAPRVKEIFEQEKFDIVHLHEPLMPMLCTTVLRLSTVPNVGTFHASGGKPWYTLSTPVGKLFLEKWFRKLDGRIAVSSVARDYANKYFPSDYTVIPNGVDTEHFSPHVLPLDEYRDGKLNILFVGRLEKRKGLSYLLEAYRQVKKNVPETRLIVVGPGTLLRRRYERKAKRAHLSDVVFAGYAGYNDLPRYYKTADIVCSPATGRESFGIVLLEAMAVGKPVVASNIEGYASVLGDGAEGILVPPKDPTLLAEALLRLLANEGLRHEMGVRGRLKALDYDWKQVSQRLLDFYGRVLKRSAPKDTAHSDGLILV